MNSNENKIIFNEIKTYEDAYYYNSDPDDRIKYDNKKVEVKKKKSNFSNGFKEVIGEIIEGALELIFSIID